MADVSHLTINNQTYDINDPTARQNYKNLSQTVSDLSNTVDNNTTTISDLQNKVNTNTGNISTLQTTVTEHTQSINNINSQLGDINNWSITYDSASATIKFMQN